MRSAGVVGAFVLLAAWMQAGAQNDSKSPHEIANQFVITLPSGWAAYDQNVAVFQRTDGLGMLIFSAEPVTKDGAADPELLAKADTGEIASFFVDRRTADKDATCAKLSRPEIAGIGTRVASDPRAGAMRRAFALSAPPRHSEIEIGGCAGVKFLIESGKNDPPNHWIIDVRAVSDGSVLYLFSLRSKAEHHAETLPAFDAAIASLRFTRPGAK